MRLTAALKHKQSAEWQSFVEKQDPVTLDKYKEYFPKGSIKLTIVAPTTGSSYAYTEQEVRAYDRFKNITDASGNVMFADDDRFVYEASVVKPVLDPLGNIYGYSCTLVKITENVING